MKPDTGPIVQNFEGPFPSGPARVISLRRRGNAPLGFSVRGGWEHGTGVFVSDVQRASEAYRQGLRAGDQIIRVNGFSIQRAIHQEVLSLLRTKPGVVITVKRVGVIPVKEKGSDQLTWKVIEPESSPTSSLLEGSNSMSSGDSYHSDSSTETKIYIPDCETSGLGCSVVNGPPEFPGIFVSSIKPGGQADQAGLQIGDQIVMANGNSFSQVKFSEAISLLKSFKELHLIVKKQAGLQLFTDPLTLNNSQNGVRNGYSPVLPHEYSTQRHKTNGYCSSNGVHSTSGSSSTEHNGCLCESEKDFSLTEVEEEAQWTGCWKDGCSAQLPRYHEDPRLAEEKRKLEEEQKRLDEERERLRKEKKKLEEERQMQNASSCEETRNSSFLAELQMTAEKISTKGKTVSVENSRKQANNNTKSPEDLAKRQRHEMLMEEIHVAHRKMFGERNPSCGSAFSDSTLVNEVFDETAKAGTNKRKTVPRPPPKPNGVVNPFSSSTLPPKKKPEERNDNSSEASREASHEVAVRRHSTEAAVSQNEGKSVHFAGFSDSKTKPRDVHVKLFPTSNLQRQRHVKPRRKTDLCLPNADVVINNKQPSQTVGALPKEDQTQTYTFSKNGPLNLKLEGGIYSTLDGAVVVGELWEGGFIPLDGKVSVGDQILKIDDISLENVSLTFASATLREAMNGSEENIRIVVKKAQKCQETPSSPEEIEFRK